MPTAEPFRHRLRVYWEDTDAGGVVFYANYLKFFERARTEWLRALGFGQEEMRRQIGTLFIVTSTSVRYMQPARLDDQLDITVEVREARQASLMLSQQAFRDGTLIAAGEIKIGCVDAQSFKPRRIPTDILQEIA